jgi:hypothetical protein
MAVPIHGAEPSAPVPLFVTRLSLQPYPSHEYMVSSDGQRFLVNTIQG